MARFERWPLASGGLHRYSLPAVLTLLALLASAALHQRFGLAAAYVPCLFASAAIAWFAGVWPAVICQFACAIAVFVSASWTPRIPLSSADIYAFWALFAFNIIFVLLTANLRWTWHLHRSAEDLEMIAHATHDSLWEWNLRTDKVWRGGNLKGIFGSSETEMVTSISRWRERLHPEEVPRVLNGIRHVIDSGQVRWTEEYLIRRNDGAYVPVSDHGFVIRTRSGKPLRMVGGMTDISKRKFAEEQLVHNAFHDALTGLPNRELFMDRLARAIQSQRSHGGGLIAVLFIDIDRFKVVNDSLGHAAGDELLNAIATRLNECIRPEDTAARYGGDEFTLLLDGVVERSDALRFANRIQQAMAAPLQTGNHQIVVNVSIGIAFADTDDPEEALRHADLAMYRAKARGSACCEVFQPSLDTRAKDLLQLETDLRQALHNRDFQLYYQPVVSLRTGQVASFEALLRWHHPRRGTMLPSSFLPLAEEAGLAISIGHWVLRESCSRLQEWRRTYPAAALLSLNVNLSGKEFMQHDLIDQLRNVLGDTGVDGQSLIIELTENMIMESDDLVSERLRRLQDLNVRLALDDFGKGHSSLARLQEFPISILKVDGSFVRRISEGRPQILDAIVALATELRLEVTTEGVETADQVRYVKQTGAATGQGVFFSDALTREAAGKLLATEPPWLSRYEKAVAEGMAAGFAAG